jgi:glycosyl transferase family 25
MAGLETTKIWVVSLANAVERRAEFARRAPSDAPAWEFFDAHTTLAPVLLHDSKAARATHGRTLRGGELGCYSSHHALWQWLLDSDCEQMVVLEDDVQVDWKFIEFLIERNFADLKVAYLRLFAKIPSRWRYVASPFLGRYHHLIRFTGYALGTQAYLLTKDGAARLLRHAQTVRYPIDVFMDRYWQHGVPNLAIYPFPVIESFQPSSIGQARFEREPIPLAMKMQFKWAKLAAKARMWQAYCFGSETTRALRRYLHGRFSG